MMPLALHLLLLVQDPSLAQSLLQLDDDDIAVRRQAAEDLFARGRGVEEALWVVLTRSRSLEASLAAEELLSRLGRLEQRTRSMRVEATGRKPVWPDIDAGLLRGKKAFTVTEERRYGKVKDDPRGVDDR